MNLKENVITSALSPAIGILNALAPELNKIEPTNPISQFVETNIQTLLINGNDNNNDMTKFLTKIFIAQSNDNPKFVLSKLLSFYEAFRIWYLDYLAAMTLEKI